MGRLFHDRWRLRALVLPAFFVLLNGAVPLAAQQSFPVNQQAGDTRTVAEWLPPPQSPPEAQGSSGIPETPQQLEEKARWESNRAGQAPSGPRSREGEVVLTRKQRQELLKSEFEKMKRDAAELAALAQSLQEDLEKSSENVLSMKIVEKANKIEGLAKKISRTARSY
jgi:hypothetical protein